MAHKKQLREQRTGTIINLTSKKQETVLGKALNKVVSELEKIFPLVFYHERDWKLPFVVEKLRRLFPSVDFHYYFENSAMKPDGGILSIVAKDDRLFPVLIAEVKNQGTNVLRAAEGLPRQARGNAIERLGKNVIGFRAAMASEDIVPFVCFGYGCDFAEDSSILDRVVTVAMFGELNKIYLMAQGPNGRFNRGSFFFREAEWSVQEMKKIMLEIAKRSIHYYYAKYTEDYFKKDTP